MAAAARSNASSVVVQTTEDALLGTVLGGGPTLQEGVDKGVEVAVEDPVHVRRLFAGAVVLDELVRVEDVRPDLGPPLYVRLLPAYGGELAFALLALELEEPRPQDAHRDLAVLVLAPLVLALHHEAGREVRDPDRRVGLVYVLPASPRGPVRIDLQVLLVNLDLHLVVYDGGDGDRGEARVPPATGVERADPDEPVDAALRREEPESVLPRDSEGGALYPGLLTLGVLDDLEGETAPLGPAPVHPGEHLGPVLRIHPARTRVYREYGVALVVLAGEEPRHLLLLEHPLDPSQLLLDLGEELPVVLREL